MSGGAPVPVVVEEQILNISDLEKAGSAKLPKEAREFYNHGSNEQQTIADNSLAFANYRLRPRVLKDVSGCDTSTTVFGRKITFPLCVSPAGLQRMAHEDGELGTSRACAKKGINMGISCFANYPMEQIIPEAQGKITHAIQLYIFKNRAMQESMVRKAEANGCKAILLTADSPVLGVRFSERRNDFRTPEGIEYPILQRATAELRSIGHEETFKGFTDEAHSWERDIPWLRSLTKMQIWIKGVLTAEDTELAIKHGCDGIIVSNHGGRQLDGVPATLDALVECVEAAAGRIPVHVDGGFRKGTDIFKALALGADCCWVGRPAIWGLAYNGEAGVDRMLDILHEEFRRVMQLMGCNTVKEITKECLGRKNANGVYAKL